MQTICSDDAPVVSAASGLIASHATEPCAGVRAEQVIEAIQIIDKLHKVCEMLQDDVGKAKSKIVQLQGREDHAEQGLMSAAYALCTFRDLVKERRTEAAIAAPAASAAIAAPVARKTLHRKPRSDVGRKVAVLWVPKGFPEDVDPELSDLVPFHGVVVKHIRSRKSGTHFVHYEDGACRWHKRDELFKFI
jgi:hypothetical protein